MFRIEFTPNEVGSHLVEVSLAGEKLAAGPLVAKVYNSSLIRVTEVGSGVVGQPCQFRGEYENGMAAACHVQSCVVRRPRRGRARRFRCMYC